jgi:hypothetical protein
MSTVSKSLQKVLKKRAQKLKEEQLTSAESILKGIEQPIIPVQKKNYNFEGTIEPKFAIERDIRKINYNFNAYLSRNEKNAMDELINEITNTFVNFRNSVPAVLDRTEKLYKIISSKINDYSKDFLEALEKLFDIINNKETSITITTPATSTTQARSSKKDLNGVESLIDGRGKEVDQISSLYDLMTNLVKNRLKRVELEKEPEIFESITEKQPTIIQPSFIETKPTFQNPDIKFENPLLPKTVAEKRERGKKVKQSEILEGALKFLGLGVKKINQQEINKTIKLEDIFGQANPKALKGGKLNKNQILAMLGEGHKIKKVAKPNDPRKIRGLKVKELMKKEGLSLAEASKRLKQLSM